MVILRETCLQKLKANTHTFKMHTKTKYHNKIPKENMHKYSSEKQGAKLQSELAVNATENWLFATKMLMLAMLAGIYLRFSQYSSCKPTLGNAEINP